MISERFTVLIVVCLEHHDEILFSSFSVRKFSQIVIHCQEHLLRSKYNLSRIFKTGAQFVKFVKNFPIEKPCSTVVWKAFIAKRSPINTYPFCGIWFLLVYFGFISALQVGVGTCNVGGKGMTGYVQPKGYTRSTL